MFPGLVHQLETLEAAEKAENDEPEEPIEIIRKPEPALSEPALLSGPKKKVNKRYRKKKKREDDYDRFFSQVDSFNLVQNHRR